MSKGLKGITVTIDGNATQLNKALSSVNANAKSLMEKIAATNEVIQNMATSDDELIVTDDGERICARKIFSTL